MSEDLDLDNSFGSATPPVSPAPQKMLDSVKYFDLKNPTNDYRIMPPMFSLKDTGRWTQNYARHWGYKNANGKQQPWMCLYKQDWKTKEVLQSCPFCDNDLEDLNNLRRAERNVQDAQENFNKATPGTPEAKQLEEVLESAKTFLLEAQGSYRAPERKFWVNVMSRDGEFGILGLPKTVYEKIAGKKEKNGTRTPGLVSELINDFEIDPFDVNQGIWFRVSKSGAGRYGTKYDVSFVNEITTNVVNGKTMKSSTPLLAPLSEEQKRKALEKCRDLGHMFDHSILSADKAQLVIDGTPEAATSLSNRPLPHVDVRPSNGFGTAQMPPRPSSITKNFENVDVDATDIATLREIFRNKK